MWKNPWRLAGVAGGGRPGLGSWGFGPGSPALAAAGPRFHVDAWGTRDGLTANEVVAIIQTHDGYLWLGTLNGLVRFDGLQFKVFDEHNTPGLPSGRIVFLFEDSKTNLWIGTETAGALLLQNNRNHRSGLRQGPPRGPLAGGVRRFHRRGLAPRGRWRTGPLSRRQIGVLWQTRPGPLADYARNPAS
jgi:hypothetical protein